MMPISWNQRAASECDLCSQRLHHILCFHLQRFHFMQITGQTTTVCKTFRPPLVLTLLWCQNIVGKHVLLGTRQALSCIHLFPVLRCSFLKDYAVTCNVHRRGWKICTRQSLNVHCTIVWESFLTEKCV